IARAQNLPHAAYRAGRTDCMVPPASPERRPHRHKFESGCKASALHALLRDLSVGKKTLARIDAAHGQALQPLGVQPIADDDLRAASADIHNQPSSGIARHGARHAQIDQARLLHTRDHFDGMSERSSRPVQKRALAARLAQRVRTDDAHAFRSHVPQSLAEALQALQCALRRLPPQPALLIEPRAEPDALAQSIQDDDLAVRVARDDHVEAVGPEVYGGDGVGNPGARHAAWMDCQWPGTRPRLTPNRLGCGENVRSALTWRRTNRNRRLWSRWGCGSRTGRLRCPRDNRFRRPSGTECSSDRSAAWRPRCRCAYRPLPRSHRK